MVEVGQNAVNFECKYVLNFSVGWQNLIRIYSDVQTKTWRVYRVDPQNARKFVLLFTVACVDENRWRENGKNEYLGYSEIFENSKNGTVVAAR